MWSPTPRGFWGRRGVAVSLATRIPAAARAFQAWTVASPGNLSLGGVHVVDVVDVEAGHRPVSIASMVARRGYGPGVSTRLNYHALQCALARVAQVANAKDAEVHLPRIGSRPGGGTLGHDC